MLAKQMRPVNSHYVSRYTDATNRATIATHCISCLE